ncbi:helix-turn-helix domain-containing protein [Parabacteroides distasonis]|uniref:Helix-turn-helix domain-containing protein n=4 Tax=Bacteria TaxID=2 RepID=A0A7J4XPW9_BACOV|nr:MULTISPECIES: helix-turn-helix domain-containing protein [Bacteria]KAA4617998.1 helix-turn-helix domain-containing protein [Bacteroides ovatus]KAB5324171.1 helix-turn-helix domain-containing protein [Bacteroides stercoris]MRY60382.1 helix-turn-helix domain-containing protein [Parabacteroides distasonis]MRY69627.1 helix-turn-helix domain-containing protein [Parabacteroides distasonis]MSA33805.1 helix-turn-helix domain-containing protein [Parabacteroides distasonis]
MTPQEFKEIRLKLGLSIELLAKKLGYSLRHVRCLESGAKPIVEKSEGKIRTLLAESRVPIKKPVKQPNHGKWQVDLDEPYHMDKHVVRWK